MILIPINAYVQQGKALPFRQRQGWDSAASVEQHQGKWHELK
ncbi:hypothetical protein [Methylomicrobium sp. Wu6]|nr:hypothetical protein [Methylomicrobium sp. Wu6]MEC4749977.1 hypothetical protein [Methylomicrobium sp. Wu6]